MLTFLKLVRADQWIKNLFVFVPLVFAGLATNPDLLLSTTVAFVAFCLAASAVYIFNDIQDVEDDRRHASKKHRPLAAGATTMGSAVVYLIVLLILALVLGWFIATSTFAYISIYVLLNGAYSLKLKHIDIVDVFTVAVGFVLRLFVGSTAAGVALSQWVVIMTFLLALFLALAKRRDDLLNFLKTGQKARKVVDGYNLKLVDAAMTIMASVVIVAYIMYATSESVVARLQSDELYLTAVFVALGILRYLQLTFVEENSGSPTSIVLRDPAMQAILVGWALAFAWIIYL